MTTHIMIIDDEPAIGKLLLYQLHTLGYSAVYIPDGLQALQRLEREQPDLILLDVMMPAISGWDVCRQIRTNSSVPIIMLTAKHSDADVVAGLTAGADDYIGKPFSMMQLQARIEAVLRRAERAPRSAHSHADVSPKRLADKPTPTIASHTAPNAPVPRMQTMPFVAQTSSTRLGPLLRETRLAKGLSLYQIGGECNIHWEFLQAIEQENFNYVPRKQLHTALHAYAGYLGLNLDELVGRPTIVPTAQQWGRRYGFVILALLVIVISVVMFSMS